MLGISVYPYKENESETLEYIKLASQYGYKRVFTNLLTIDVAEKETIIGRFKKVILYARQLGMEVVLDINPNVFDKLNISYNDLSFFKQLGATGIRLDSTFSGLEESLMTYDASDLDLEINISNDTYYLENLRSYASNLKKIIGCHNFYPQRYTGLDYDYFIKCSSKYKNMGLRTAAFVNSHSADHGPHEYMDGLCTLEIHRDLPIEIQAKHLIATGVIDDIIIANTYASQEELARLSNVCQDMIELDVEFVDNISDLEKDIVLNNQHFNRGDINSYSIRSTFVKLKYKNINIVPQNTQEKLFFGDITIGNNSFGQYKGELNIVKQTMKNIGSAKNVVARVTKNNKFLIQYINPWTKFKFKEKSGGNDTNGRNGANFV